MNNIRPQLHLQPGDRVRLIKNVYDNADSGREMVVLLGSEGSTGIVVSSDEYCTYEQERLAKLLDHMPNKDFVLQRIEEETGNGFVYPIRLEEIAPPKVPFDLSECQIGKIQPIETFRYISHGSYEQILEKIE
jgi:hypothetical protein